MTGIGGGVTISHLRDPAACADLGGELGVVAGIDGQRLPAAAAAGGHYGWTGVELFFMISGFVICLSGLGPPAR